MSSITDEDLLLTGEPDRQTLRTRDAHAGPVHDDTVHYRVGPLTGERPTQVLAPREPNALRPGIDRRKDLVGNLSDHDVSRSAPPVPISKEVASETRTAHERCRIVAVAISEARSIACVGPVSPRRRRGNPPPVIVTDKHVSGADLVLS